MQPGMYSGEILECFISRVPVEVGRLLRYTMTHDFVAGDFMWTGIDYLGEAHWPAPLSFLRGYGYLWF
ncbi:MAG: hypothetical protein WCD89_08820 [Anaerocolumna sp.]